MKIVLDQYTRNYLLDKAMDLSILAKRAFGRFKWVQGKIENSEADPWEHIFKNSSNTIFFVWILFYSQGLSLQATCL
jgi:hypothetical protein